MAHLLKNKNLELKIDLPADNYQLGRFDWTGKIVSLQYKQRPLTTSEIAGAKADSPCGRGLYNEFGIEAPIAYEETSVGGWFHKIGVGLLKKEAPVYDFAQVYTIRPASFKVTTAPDKILLQCKSAFHQGYAYYLEKEIRLLDSGFKINYRLENTGEKTITTSEYNHNFLSIDGALVGSDYLLKFPFQIKPESFIETVNPEQAVTIGQREIKFTRNPQTPFFFSNLSGGASVEAKWALENTQSGIGISESASFLTNSINLWGWKHVLSPELFLHLTVKTGQSKTWLRTYTVYEL